MPATSAALTPARQSRAARTIFWAGLVCGVMDISAAFITWAPKGITPIRILQSVASGWLGRASLSGGYATAALGLATHFFIAYSWATAYYVVSRKVAFLVERPWVAGPMYGVLVYGVMYWVVRPLSNVPPSGFSWFNTVVAIVTHIICVGTPIAVVTAALGKARR
ncbi:MAG: hypothetical protein ACREN6_02925 [Gemmatimonadaceae bacterium]